MPTVAAGVARSRGAVCAGAISVPSLVGGRRRARPDRRQLPPARHGRPGHDLGGRSADPGPPALNGWSTEQKVDPARVELANINGNGGQVWVKWIVRRGGLYTITVDSEKGGLVSRTLGAK
jgi:hypothetical protein